MKLIIDITDDEFNMFRNAVSSRMGNSAMEHIVKGIPLDDVIGKIDKAYDDLDGYDPSALGTFANRVSDILDNIGKAESEVKPNE